MHSALSFRLTRSIERTDSPVRITPRPTWISQWRRSKFSFSARILFTFLFFAFFFRSSLLFAARLISGFDSRENSHRLFSWIQDKDLPLGVDGYIKIRLGPD